MLDSKNFENLIENEEILEYFNSKVVPAYLSCKKNRQELEDRWERYLKIWEVMRGADQLYDGGGADIKQSVVRRAIETVQKKNYQAFFGGGTQYFSVVPSFGSMGATIDDAEAIENTIKHFWEGKTDIKGELVPHFRQKAIFGTGVTKSYWEDKRRVTKRRGRETVVETKFPRVVSIDLFKWYGFPDNVRRIEDLSITFEEFFRDESFVKKMKDDGFYPEDFEPGANAKKLSKDQNRAQILGMSSPNTSSDHGHKFFNLVEVYFIYHDSNNVEHMMMAHMTEGGQVAFICESPFEHGEFPYAIDKHVESAVPCLYGEGIPQVSESQYYELNDISNQMMDSRTLALNPIVVMDPNGIRDYKTIKIAPRAKWLADPKAIDLKTFPDLSSAGINAFQLVKNEIIESAESTPNLPPQMRGASRTATRDQAMQVEMNSELSETMSSSARLCVRMLKLTHGLIVQYCDDDMIIRINKKKSAGFLFKAVTIDDLNADVEFIYKPAQDTSMDRVAVNQLTNIVKIAAAFPDVKLKTGNILRKMLTEGFGFEESEEILESDSLSQEMPQEIENKLLRIGKKIPISVNDDDMEHLRIMQEEFGVSKPKKKATIEAILDHIKRHQDAYQLKQSVMQQQMQQVMAEQYANAMGGQTQGDVNRAGGGQTLMKEGSEADRTGTANTNMEQSVNNG